jgi:hypothetical protein
MASLTRSSSSLPPVGNPRAFVAVLCGLLAIAMVPLGVAASYYSARVTLINSTYGSVPAGCVLGLCAIMFGRRARDQVIRTIGRSGGEATAHVGRLLGALGVCMAVTAGLAIAFYGLLTVFAQ